MALRSWAQVEAFLDWCLVMVGIPSLHIYPWPLTLTPVRDQIDCSSGRLCSPLLKPGGFRTLVWDLHIALALSKDNPCIEG